MTESTAPITPPVEAASAKAEKPTLEQLLARYSQARDEKTAGKMSAADFDSLGRTLRRQIRALGGSVNSLKPEAVPVDPNAPKPEKVAKAPKAKKGKAAKVEAGLDGDPKAQPAGLGHVTWMESILNGSAQLGEDPQITPLLQRSVTELEQSGEYGYGLDLLSDVLPRQAIAKFESRFGYLPTWFCMNKPADYSVPNALTLLILGPAPEGQTTTPDVQPETAAANAEDADAEEATDGEDEAADDDESEDVWGEDEVEA